MSQSIIERLDTALVEDSADGGLFELEIKHLLERNWVYLAHESSEQERLFHGGHSFKNQVALRWFDAPDPKCRRHRSPQQTTIGSKSSIEWHRREPSSLLSQGRKSRTTQTTRL
jgi:hypothetical protein